MNFASFFIIAEINDLLEAYFPPSAYGDNPTGWKHGDTPGNINKKNTYYNPEGKLLRADDRWDRLEAIKKVQVAKGVDPNRLWVTFSELPKVGQRMHVHGGKSTPVGIFVF